MKKKSEIQTEGKGNVELFCPGEWDTVTVPVIMLDIALIML